MSTDETPAAGRFGDFELLRYFTAGGMADLYLARSPRFGSRELVLKRVQARYLDHTRVVRMFIDEGRIARLLDHPNVVRVVDVGQAEGAFYIAMEYIHGHDLVALGRRAAEAGLHIPRAVAVGALSQVAAGLEYAHARTDEQGRPLRIVHCDVSPGNVVISFDGVAKIVDFGIARATIALREEDGVAGKYNYMAPEQVRGEPFDARADLFSLGVMLHELTVGRRLFRGPPHLVMGLVCEAPIPPPGELVPGYPRSLERIVMRLLERDPERRYPSAGAVHADLREYLAAEEQGWDGPSLSRFLRSLFEAPRREGADPAVSIDGIDDSEVDRGMPEAPELDVAAAPPSPRPPPPLPPRLPLPPTPAPSGALSGLVVAGSAAMLVLAMVLAWLIVGR